jgi:hypothetical protein
VLALYPQACTALEQIPIGLLASPVPKRALLEQPVTANVTGTVVDAVRSLAEAQGLDWVVGLPGPTAGPSHTFKAAALPLWRALDGLLQVYGYDWGVQCGVVVCWPALQPIRARERPHPLPDRKRPSDASVADGGAFDLKALTPLSDAVAQPRRDINGMIYSIDRELSGWRVAGRVAAPDGREVAAIAAAVCADMEGAGTTVQLKVGACWRLSEAWQLLDRMPKRAASPISDLPKSSKLCQEVIGLVSAQQWALVRQFGTAEIAFRELPTETAAVLLAAIREQTALRRASGNPPLEVDWTLPGKMKVTVALRPALSAAGAGPQAHERYYVGVEAAVPLTDGSFWGF